MCYGVGGEVEDEWWVVWMWLVKGDWVGVEDWFVFVCWCYLGMIWCGCQGYQVCFGECFDFNLQCGEMYIVVYCYCCDILVVGFFQQMWQFQLECVLGEFVMGVDLQQVGSDVVQFWFGVGGYFVSFQGGDVVE